LAGLAAAERLTQDGLRALVVEREDEPGGRVRSEEWEGCTIELGATFITPAYSRVRRLLDDFGLSDRLKALPNTFRTAIRRNGAWRHLDYRRPELELVRYRGIRPREKAALLRLLPSQLRVATSLRFFDIASAAAVDARTLEDVVGARASRYFTSPVAELFCGYPPEDVSLAFAVLGARYPTRRMWTLEGGLGTLTGELARALSVRCGVQIERVWVEEEDVIAKASDGGTLRARGAILATRAPEAAGIWQNAPERVRRFLSTQGYSQGFGVFLRTSAPVRRFDARGRELLMDLIPRGEGPGALHGVLYLNDTAPDGGLIGLAGSSQAVAADLEDAELAARLESELAEVLPELRPAVTARRILRWPIFVPSYPVGRARELADFRGRLAPGPIQLAGDYLYGPMMEAAARAGQDAAARVSEYLTSDS
jgi:predicted NAD/FAD-dependent oxidoreductase